jgi:hypothetical protein
VHDCAFTTAGDVSAASEKLIASRGRIGSTNERPLPVFRRRSPVKNGDVSLALDAGTER